MWIEDGGAVRAIVVVFVAVVMGLGIGASEAVAQQDSSATNAKMLEDLGAVATRIDGEISSAEEKDGSLSDGLIKSLVEARIEVLRLTRDMIRHRIVALQTGAVLTIEAPATKPNPVLSAALEGEITSQLSELEKARNDAAAYKGGLIGAMKEATVATKEQTLAMLEQRQLTAKYGLVSAPVASEKGNGVVSSSGRGGEVSETATGTPVGRNSIVEVKLLSKRFAEQDYQEYIWFDIEISATSLKKPARAIKGVLNLQDLFGESKMKINWTIEEPLKPGGSIVEKGTGFEYNQFRDSHQWVKNTELSNMTASFTVKSILYQDGSRADF